MFLGKQSGKLRRKLLKVLSSGARVKAGISSTLHTLCCFKFLQVHITFIKKKFWIKTKLDGKHGQNSKH